MTWVGLCQGKPILSQKRCQLKSQISEKSGDSKTSQNKNGREIEIHETPEGPPGVTTQKERCEKPDIGQHSAEYPRHQLNL